VDRCRRAPSSNNVSNVRAYGGRRAGGARTHSFHILPPPEEEGRKEKREGEEEVEGSPSPHACLFLPYGGGEKRREEEEVGGGGDQHSWHSLSPPFLSPRHLPNHLRHLCGANAAVLSQGFCVPLSRPSRRSACPPPLILGGLGGIHRTRRRALLARRHHARLGRRSDDAEACRQALAPGATRRCGTRGVASERRRRRKDAGIFSAGMRCETVLIAWVCLNHRIPIYPFYAY